MVAKTKKITVIYNEPDLFSRKTWDPSYSVLKVINSVEFNPGQRLSKLEVEELTIARNWEVTVIRPPKGDVAA